MKAPCKILILLFSLSILGCKKSDQDPFFDSFPKEFVFESIEEVSSPRLFTNKKEVINPEAINKFTYNFNYFKNKQVVADYYKNDTFNFVSNSFIKYSGINEWRYGDTLTYIKSGISLQIKSEVYRRLGNAFLPCNLPVCHINKWGIDSIDYIYNGMAGPDVSAYVFNTRYEVFGDELHIPIFGYRYKSLYYGESALRDNEFNEKVILELTSDTLAVIEYNLIFKKQSEIL